MTAPDGVRVTETPQKQARDQWVLPPVEEVRPDVWSIPVPMGDNPLHYVFSYAFLAEDDLVLVDPGWPSQESYDVLAAGLATAGRRVEDVTGVLVTHAHHDHYGLADRVREASGAWVAMHSLDADLQVVHGDDLTAVQETRRGWLRRCGADLEESLEHGSDMAMIELSAVVAGPDRQLQGGERFRVGRFDLEAVWTPGHSPGHVVLHERTERLLLSGDHVLPRITPNISAFAGHGEGALGSYLDSLRLIADLDVTEVLPGHEYRFTDLRARVDTIVAHHERRLAEILSALEVDEPATPWTLSERLTWSRPWSELRAFSRRSAVGETLSHLHLLHTRGAVDLIDVDEVWHWRTTESAALTTTGRDGGEAR